MQAKNRHNKPMLGKSGDCKATVNPKPTTVSQLGIVPFFPPSTPLGRQLTRLIALTDVALKSRSEEYEAATPHVEKIMLVFHSRKGCPRQVAAKVMALAKSHNVDTERIIAKIRADDLRRLEALRANHGSLSEEMEEIERQLLQEQSIVDAECDMYHATDTLYRAAIGENAAAAIALAKRVHHAVTLLTAICKLFPDLMKSYGERVHDWPMLVDYSAKIRNPNYNVLKAIGIRPASPAKPGVKHSDAASRAWAEEIVKHLESNRLSLRRVAAGEPLSQWQRDCAALPQFDNTSCVKWWALGKALLEAECPNLSEMYPRTKEIKASLSKRGNPTQGRIVAKIVGEIRSSFFIISTKNIPEQAQKVR